MKPIHFVVHLSLCTICLTKLQLLQKCNFRVSHSLILWTNRNINEVTKCPSHHTMYRSWQVAHHDNLACVISGCGTPLLHNNLESIMNTLFKLVYQVGLVNNKWRSILCVTNPLAKNSSFTLILALFSQRQVKFSQQLRSNILNSGTLSTKLFGSPTKLLHQFNVNTSNRGSYKNTYHNPNMSIFSLIKWKTF